MCLEHLYPIDEVVRERLGLPHRAAKLLVLETRPDPPTAGHREEPHLAIARLAPDKLEHRLRIGTGQPLGFRHVRRTMTDDRQDCSMSRIRTERAELPGGLLKETQKTRPRTAANTACNGSCSPSTRSLARINGLSSVFMCSCGRSSVKEGDPFLKR